MKIVKRSPPLFLGATYGQRGGSRICLLQLGRQVAGVTRGGRRGLQAKEIALIREAKNAHTPEDRRGKEKELRTLRKVSTQMGFQLLSHPVMTIWVAGVFFNVLNYRWPSTNGVILVQLLFTIICFFAFGLFAVNINLVQDFGPWYFLISSMRLVISQIRPSRASRHR